MIETVGQATWSHSLKSMRPGGRVIVSGSTSGPNPPSDLARVFFLQLSVIGSTMGTRDELESMIELLDRTGVRPQIAREMSMDDAMDAFVAMSTGDVVGKLVLTR